MTDERHCVFCNARALYDYRGEIVAWAAPIDYNGAGPHEHETIEGKT